MANLRSNSASSGELLVELDRESSIPLHRQVAAAIRDAIRAGRLAAGGALPSSRALAADLGLSRGVVVEAYQQLTAEGYLASRTGGYTQVAATQVPSVPPRPAVPDKALAIDFRYGRPDVSRFPRSAWLRSVRRVMNEAPNERLVYLDGRGAPELREALADYLNRVRGTWATPDNIVVCTGFAQGFALIARLLARDGRRLAVEDPSDDGLRRIAVDAGLDVVGIPVDADGLRIDALEKADVHAVLVTAAHQCPTGAVLPARSRAELVDWAARRGALVIEDDYDAEYRYDHAPIGALQGLAPEHVIYAGSASKTLAPGLRLGWLVVPGRLAGPLAAAKHDADMGSPVLEQLVFADFLAHGEFDRHLRRMRPIYRRRRDLLLAALADRLPQLQPAGVSAGLHVLTWLPPELDEAAIVAAAMDRGLGVYGLAPYRMSAIGDGGLIFGYGALNERRIEDGIALLADVIATL